MLPYKSYVVWNNKGGTGKTTLVFQLSAEYAKLHPTEQVVVIDMCPQANVSTALLPKNYNPFFAPQPGEQTVSTVSQFKNVMIGSSGMTYESTICGYLMAKLDRHDTVKGTIPFSSFLHHVIKYNKYIPNNVFLLCGDLYLEVLSKRLEQERQLLPTNYDKPWKRVTLYIKDFIEGLISNDPLHTYTFFIDTSPSFSIYTEMAISAAKRLIVPFTADDFSLTALKSMLYLVYGYESEYNRRLDSFKESQYFWLAKHHEIMYPKLHLFVNNRVTFYKDKPAVAFAAIGVEVGQILKNVYTNRSEIFEMHVQFAEYPLNPDPIGPFRRRYMIDLHDFHTMGILSIHLGCPISQLLPIAYDLFGRTVLKVPENHPGLNSYNKDIFDIVKML
ncbi:uncharacterized protein LOC127716229 [Mytilus californianus]|uniref:uncharacterized protein LOC127716229 n=1 Tax=Mytilus californianus TaxID=6549 RepID=UPI00224666E7|nr:uncharacterized protein LOC127716229 [Mytilus californianus]